jgi:hypothetical protein
LRTDLQLKGINSSIFVNHNKAIFILKPKFRAEIPSSKVAPTDIEKEEPQNLVLNTSCDVLVIVGPIFLIPPDTFKFCLPSILSVLMPSDKPLPQLVTIVSRNDLSHINFGVAVITPLYHQLAPSVYGSLNSGANSNEICSLAPIEVTSFEEAEPTLTLKVAVWPTDLLTSKDSVGLTSIIPNFIGPVSDNPAANISPGYIEEAVIISFSIVI